MIISWTRKRMQAIRRVANMADLHNLQDHAALRRVVRIIETEEGDSYGLAKLCKDPASYVPLYRTSLGGCTRRLRAA